MADKTFFTVMIESVEPEQSFIQVFWTSADHPGQAIQKILRACARLGIKNPHACELDSYDFNSMPRSVVRNTSLDIYYSRARNYFPTEKTFLAPDGIVKAFLNGKYDYDLIREGFHQRRTKAGIYEIEVVVERERLFDTFVQLIKRLSSIKVFWIKLAADWEDAGREELWTNEKLNTVELIADFLKACWNDTVANGHVALTAYSAVGQTNLLIDTHKTIKILTKSATVQRKMSAALRRLGFEQLSKFHSLEYGYYHWHYRPSRSKSRTRLIGALRRGGFTLWKTCVVTE
ncbi:MAG TPA: hypothetical protein VFZ22_09270 [Pyrinomonadaceae bacterium]|nr:hypothetical protein [Pyrinomonadaceae bacterium]